MTYSSFYTAATDFEYPQDEPEAENEYREKALEMIRILSLALYHVLKSRTPSVSAFGIAYALGLTSVLGNERMASRARKLGVNKSAITRAAVKFLEESGLPPSILMQRTHAPIKRRFKPAVITSPTASGQAAVVMALYTDSPTQLELDL